jgi:hypothetical protein
MIFSSLVHTRYTQAANIQATHMHSFNRKSKEHNKTAIQQSDTAIRYNRNKLRLNFKSRLDQQAGRVL